MSVHPSHTFTDLSGYCANGCGAHCLQVEARLRCVPEEPQEDVESGVTEEFSE